MVIKQTPIVQPSAALNGNSSDAEKLVSAQFAPPAAIELAFADDYRCSLAIERLEMPLDRFRWSTLEVAQEGKAIQVQGVKDDSISIDAKTIRYLADPTYAAQMDQAHAALQLSREELERIGHDNAPPKEWFAEPERDLKRESWK
jgi:hypothetical protein